MKVSPKWSLESVSGVKQGVTEVQGPITELSRGGVTCPPTQQQSTATE